MRLLFQIPYPDHLAELAESLRLRGDDVHAMETLADAQALAEQVAPEALAIAYSEEAMAWWLAYRQDHPACRAVILAPREMLAAVLARHPDATVLPLPGTAMAIRCALTADPATDPACALGDYQLLALDALGRRSHIFRALQKSIHRPVTLRLLNQELEQDPPSVEGFLEDIRAKAAVTHDRIGAVYQALEDHGAIFYTAEVLDGPSLDDLAGRGQRLAPEMILEVVRTLASALVHLESRGLASAPIELRHIHLCSPGQMPRIANQAMCGAYAAGHHASLLQHTLAVLLPMVDTTGEAGQRVAAWLQSLVQQATASLDLGDVVANTRTMLASLNSPQDGPGGSTARDAQSPRGMIAMVVAAALVALVALVVVNQRGKNPPQRIVGDAAAVISFAGGSYTHPTLGAFELKPFNLDKQEVTIREYALFLEAEELEPGKYDDPMQARHQAEKKSHKPKDWDQWYPIALGGGMYEDCRLTLDCPVFNVDLWDAQAFARWDNRRLPTREEWEVAARGQEWRKYPWGNNWDAARANGSDKPAPIDGHKRWCPVDLPEGDTTPDGVHGMAGNVSEWTASETVHPDYPDRSIPVVKGGSFGANIDAGQIVRVQGPKEQKPWLGFRTAASLSQP